MKKITLSLFTFLVSSAIFGQTYTTGMLTLDAAYSAKIDVDSNSNIVTITLNAPSDRYFGLGFGVLNMLTNGSDCVIFTGTEGTGLNILSDRTFNGNTSTPSIDSGGQSWNVLTNSVSGGTRTLVATRPRVSSGDFTFPTTAGSLDLAWSRNSNAGYALNYHGGTRAGINVGYNLSNDSFNVSDFTIYPNPAKGFTNINLPTNLDAGTVKIYDNLGRVVINQEISVTANQIQTSNLTTGSYLVVLRTEYGNATKTLLVE
jgi:hypothetical protein